MRITFVLPAALVMFGATGPVFASSCSEQIATIERRFDSAGAEQVTDKEPPGGPTSSHSAKALDKAPGVKPTDPGATASAGGIEEARNLIKKARAQDKAGDMKGCEDTMTEVKKKAGALP
jgi:hypothetical protein